MSTGMTRPPSRATVEGMTDLRISGPAQPGEILDGRYRLDELIGEGGMGSVWRASDQALGRTVAIKIFSPGTTEDSDAVRRESEKRLLASVNHPSLVTLFDAHLSADARSYLVMEYIDGGTLAGVISGGAINVRDAASLAADLGEALHVVHGAGIIHRDVKPANILLRPPLTPNHTFRAVLADFGIAYLVDSARVTTPGTAIGTAAYISPEQVRGHAPTPASDIYSLGLVLLEALSGRRPFPQQTPIEAISVRLTSPPDVPGDWGFGWRSLLTSMTAIDPAQRPTALEVSERGRALDSEEPEPETTRAIASEPTATKVLAAPADIAIGPPPPLPDEPTRLLPHAPATSPAVAAPATRRRWAVIIGAVVIALVLVGVVVGTSLAIGQASPTPAPTLPALEEPLNTHLQDLMDEVSP